MTESAAVPPSAPEPSWESDGTPLPAAEAGKASPLGSVWNYRMAPPMPSMMNRINVAGEIVEAPARDEAMAAATIASDWASPLAPLRNAFRNLVGAVLFYWFSYGAVLALSLYLVDYLHPRGTGLDFNILGLVAFFGPYFGVTLDFLMAKSSVLGLPAVAGFVVGDALLFYLLIFTDDWRTRFKYCGFTICLVLGKVLLTAFL